MIVRKFLIGSEPPVRFFSSPHSLPPLLNFSFIPLFVYHRSLILDDLGRSISHWSSLGLNLRVVLPFQMFFHFLNPSFVLIFALLRSMFSSCYYSTVVWLSLISIFRFAQKNYPSSVNLSIFDATLNDFQQFHGKHIVLIGDRSDSTIKVCFFFLCFLNFLIMKQF